MKTFLRCAAVGLALLCLGAPARADFVNITDTAGFFQATLVYDSGDPEADDLPVTVFTHFGPSASVRYQNPEGILSIFPQDQFSEAIPNAGADPYDLGTLDVTFPNKTGGTFTSLDTGNPIPFSYTNASLDSLGVFRVTFSFGTAPAPVPEPSSYALLGIAGLIGGVVYRRRKLAVS